MTDEDCKFGEYMVNIFGINLYILIQRAMTVVIGSLFFLSGFVYIGKNEMGIKIKRFGEKPPEWRMIAHNDEKGVRQDILTPGTVTWLNPIKWGIEKKGLTIITCGQVGISAINEKLLKLMLELSVMNIEEIRKIEVELHKI